MTKRSNNMVGAYLKGVSVVRAYLDDNNYLIIELSDGEQQTAGQIPACDTVLNNESLKPLTNKAVTDHFALERALTASSLAKKVDKDDGKGLSTEDFTTAFKVKLEGLENYDDTAVRSMIKATEARLNALVGQSASDAIDTFNEIVNFLASIEDTNTLEGILAGIEQHITANQMNIATLTSRVDAEEKKNIVLIYSLDKAGLEGEKVATLQNNNYIDLLTLLYNQGTVKPAVDVYIQSLSGDRHWLTDTIVSKIGNRVQLSGLILTKGWVYYVKISHELNTQTANYQCTSEYLSKTQTLYYNYEDITLAEGKTLALRDGGPLLSLKQYYSPFSVIVNIFTIDGNTFSFIARCSYSDTDKHFTISGEAWAGDTNILRNRIIIKQPINSNTATITDIYEQNIARAEDITALTDRIATASMTLRGTFTATDPDSPVVWTTPYDELLRIAESMKRAETGEDDNTLYYIILDGPIAQLRAQLSYNKPFETWLGEAPFTFAPQQTQTTFTIHLYITLPEDDNTRLQADCWVGRKQLPTMIQINENFVAATSPQMFGPIAQLRARTNIGLPIHRLWMQLDRSEGVEGVFCICKRAEGYDEENAATIAAMVAANDSDTPSHDMFLITIFDGNTAVTGELNMINGDMWGSEIILGAGFGNKHTWLFSVDAEMVGQGDIDLSRVQFCNLPTDITRSAVITGTHRLSLDADQIDVVRGNLQIYTVVCDGMGNSLTTASQTALQKMYEVQQGADVADDSLFIIKIADGGRIYPFEVTYSGTYWVGLTSSNSAVNANGAFLYPIIGLQAQVGRTLQGNRYIYTINHTSTRSHLLSDSALPNMILPTVDSALHPLRANTAQSFEATQLAQLRANMHITDTWLLSAKPRITIFYPLDAAKGNVPRMTITHPLAEAGGVEGEFVLMRWQRRRPWEKADQRGRFKPSRWCAAKPVMIQNAGWDPDQDPLPESMRKPYIFAADVRGNDFYKMLVDILLYTAFYTTPAEEGEQVRGEGPLWEGDVAEGWEPYLPAAKERVTYCWARGANACDIGIAYRVLNPAYEGHVGAKPDGIPAPDPNEEWQAWDSGGNPRWLYSNVAPMRISRGGAITKSYRNEQRVRYPLLRVVEK